MLAFTNTLKTKAEAIALSQANYDADNYIQGTFWENGKGCSVGCMVHEYREKTDTDWHAATEPLYGIPQQLSFLQDRIFECLPVKEAKEWTVRFFHAIPDGADLSMAASKLVYWLMTDPGMVLKHADDAGKKVINSLADLYKRRLEGDEPDGEEWEKAAEAAWRSALGSGTRSTAETIAVLAAAAAASAAPWAGEKAAAGPQSATAYAAVWAGYEKIADKLIEILETSPVTKTEGGGR